MEYPYIIKPACIHLFWPRFHTKCFVIHSYQELEDAAQRLENEDLEVMVQEIIPGKELYSLSTYFNKKSEPLAICGYDKLRQYPPDFGIGSIWRSAWRSGPIDLGIQVLKLLKYHGLAEPEFKRDPRDGKYKFLEINARSIMLNSLPTKCGADITYIAYLDTIGQYKGNSVSSQDGVLWIYEVFDLLSCLIQIKGGKLGVREIFKSFRGKKVLATATWDDPVPFFVFLFNLTRAGLKRLFRRKK
jgi:predicted ATP-grasp superfamily ATP-dependent carboligase